jgi:hypothetical protein
MKKILLFVVLLGLPFIILSCNKKKPSEPTDNPTPPTYMISIENHASNDSHYSCQQAKLVLNHIEYSLGSSGYYGQIGPFNPGQYSFTVSIYVYPVGVGPWQWRVFGNGTINIDHNMRVRIVGTQVYWE